MIDPAHHAALLNTTNGRYPATAMVWFLPKSRAMMFGELEDAAFACDTNGSRKDRPRSAVLAAMVELVTLCPKGRSVIQHSLPVAHDRLSSKTAKRCNRRR